ncbi:hypothetical protein ACQRWP_16865 [Micromonospora trifolii]
MSLFGDHDEAGGVLDGECEIAVAVAWQRASGGDWTCYAADVNRRNNT